MQRRRSEPLFTRRRSVAIHAVMLAAAVTVTAAQTAPTAAGTLARIQTANRVRFGYRVDARPFSYQDQSGNAAGYSIALCQRIAGAVERELGLRDLSIDWVPIAAEDRFRAVQQGTVDLLCGADTVTLGRRAEVAFSIPIFPGGISALLRADAPVRLREALSGRQTPYPTWRASASRVLQARSFGVVQGTTAAKWLSERIDELEIVTTVSPVNSYEAGVQAVLARRADALFGERAILLDAARRHAAPRDLLVIDRLFTYEPMALTLAADDDRFRLLVDRTLSRFYGSGEFGAFYTKWFGEPDESAINFFRWSTIPD